MNKLGKETIKEIVSGVKTEMERSAYNQAIIDVINTFKANTWDEEVGNSYINKMLEKFEKLKK